MVIRHGPQGAALFGILRERNQRGHQNDRHNRRRDIEVVDKEPVAKSLKSREVDPLVDPLRQAHVELLDIRPPHNVAHAFQHEGQTDGRHEQQDRLLIDQVSEDEPLHRPGQRHHHHHGQQNRQQSRHMPSEMVDIRPEYRVDQMRKRHLPLHDPHQSQRRKKRHHALRVVEDARGLEDQHEAQRDQSIKHPRHQPIQRHLHRKEKLVRHQPLLSGHDSRSVSRAKRA